MGVSKAGRPTGCGQIWSDLAPLTRQVNAKVGDMLQAKEQVEVSRQWPRLFLETVEVGFGPRILSSVHLTFGRRDKLGFFLSCVGGAESL